MSEQENPLPSKVIHIDLVRVDYGRRKICTCKNCRFEIDYANHLLYCRDCHAIIDPFDAIYKYALYYDRINRETDALFEQRKELANYKPRLVVIKKLESMYRSPNSDMLPTCPHCGEIFDLSELLTVTWKNRRFFRRVKTDE